MIKAVFLDYSGTLIPNNGEDLDKLVQRVIANSRIPDAGFLAGWWMENLRKLENEAYLDAFQTEEELCLKLLRKLEHEWGLKDNLYELQQLHMNYWVQGTLYSDVVDFFHNCTAPIYIVTNLGRQYVRICLRRNTLHVNGIIDAEMVKAYKPHEEIFRKALEVSESSPEEVLYIGDALDEEVQTAINLGMNAVLLDRTRTINEAPCRIVRKLSETLRYL